MALGQETSSRAESRCMAQSLGFEPLVPPKEDRVEAWQYDAELYKRRHEIERLAVASSASGASSRAATRLS
jgi:hypothetical protein